MTGAGDERPGQKAAGEASEPLLLAWQDEEQDFVLGEAGREGEEQRQVQVLVGDGPDEERADDRAERADQVIDVEPEGSPLRLERGADRVEEEQRENGEDRPRSGRRSPRQEEERDQAPDLAALH